MVRAMSDLGDVSAIEPPLAPTCNRYACVTCTVNLLPIR
jgi:hypothetical protein